jgi:poly-gamma-glutamate synthesis protein (capsule biosynthesis protein)
MRLPRVRLAWALAVVAGLGLGLVFFVYAPPVDQTTVVLVDAYFQSSLERALAAFTRHYPQHAITLAAAGGDYRRALRRGTAALAVVSGEGPPLFYAPTLLAVAPLDALEGISSSRAHRLLRGYDPEGQLELVEFASVKTRGFMRPGEVTTMAWTQRAAWLRPLKIDGVEPSYDQVRRGRYPLHTAAVVVKPHPLVWRYTRRVPVAAKDFLAFLQSPVGQQALYGQEPELTLLAVGDVMLGRHVATKMRLHGLEYPFGKVRDLLAAADLVFANLESPLGVKGRPIPNKGIWFRGPPEGAAVLRDAGIDVVSVANNHILDYDTENLMETLGLLDQHGVAWAGAGRNLEEARRPAILERNGITVAFLAYTEFADADLFWSRQYPRTFLAGPQTPGCAPLDLDMITQDVALARARADIVVVSFHWGQEYVNHPVSYMGQDLQEVARRTIDAGAHMVLGHHPHAIQGIEFYRGAIIAYSLGNFVMDQTRPITTESMILRIGLSAGNVRSLQVLPVRIRDHRPQLATGADAAYLTDKIRSISLPLYPQPAQLQGR